MANYPTEFLNRLPPSRIPPHKRKLKIGAIVMLLRSLDVKQGLCNGIRLIVRRLRNHTIDCEVATGSNKGSRVIIPRITVAPSDIFLPFKGRGRIRTGIGPRTDSRKKFIFWCRILRRIFWCQIQYVFELLWCIPIYANYTLFFTSPERLWFSKHNLI